MSSRKLKAGHRQPAADATRADDDLISLKPQTSFERAQAEMTALNNATGYPNTVVRLERMQDFAVGRTRPVMALLGAGGG